MVSLMGRGVVVTTVTTADAPVPDAAVSEQALARLSAGDADAVCLTPGGGASYVLAAPADVLYVKGDALDTVDPGLVDRVRTARDPRVAMLDLQWRLNLAGFRVLALDGPLRTRPTTTIGEQRARIAEMLSAVSVLPGSELRGPLTSAAELYLLHSGLYRAGVDTTTLDLERSPGGDDVGTLRLPAAGMATVLGLDAALDTVPETAWTRRTVQSRRRVPDRSLTPMLEPALGHLLGADSTEDLARLSEVLDLVGVRPRLDDLLHVLVVAGPSAEAEARARSLADELRGEVRLRLVVDGAVDDASPLADQPAWADAIVLVAATLDDLPGAVRCQAPLLADLSTLDVVEWLVSGPASGHRAVALRDLVSRADVVLARDAQQRDVLLGALAGQVRVNAAVYDEDPSLMSLVRVAGDGDLGAFCRSPRRAADANLPPFERPQRQSDLALAAKVLRDGGPAALASKVMGRVRRAYARRTAGGR